ncbi:hypothetical protein LP52_05970 [Streptomonospora alba]|uniref:Uncharacterized protein n=1 Tax=Streptomonospora alba TaxID=183763 RepID=A0A0C2JEI1_9ACTN|nr:hypothetical protein [Streptomonospora alba]KIH99751.1 hypothetical protein LP52_05970 [Streptomonospora alba]
MPAATTYGGHAAPWNTVRPTAPQPDRPGPPDDPAALDAAQNAALASLIRHLADSRPEIIASGPAATRPPQTAEPPPHVHRPRSAGSGRPGTALRSPEPEPPLRSPHGCPCAHSVQPARGARRAEPPAPPGNRSAPDGRGRARPFRDFGGVVGAAAVAAATAALVARVLTVLAL